MAKITIVAALFVAGCAAAPPPVEYSVNAQASYERGIDQLHHKDWSAAAQYFSFVTSRFPYSKYAELAELGLADIQLDTAHYGAALAGYRRFEQDHPYHDLVENGEVSFRMGQAYARSSCGR
jgi:outer membrane protein assembly factor BamD